MAQAAPITSCQHISLLLLPMRFLQSHLLPSIHLWALSLWSPAGVCVIPCNVWQSRSFRERITETEPDSKPAAAMLKDTNAVLQLAILHSILLNHAHEMATYLYCVSMLMLNKLFVPDWSIPYTPSSPDGIVVTSSFGSNWITAITYLLPVTR